MIGQTLDHYRILAQIGEGGMGNKVPGDWLDTYRDRQLETKEPTFNARKKAKAGPKVVTMKSSKLPIPKSSAS